MTRALVVGDVMLDVVVRPTGTVAPTSDTPAATRVGRGGSSANVAVALAGAGVDVVHTGAVGADAAADLIAADLAAHGVATRWERLDAPTGVVVAVVSPEGQRAMLTDRGANSRLSFEFLAGELERGFDHVHVSGYTILDEATRDAGARLLARARERGASTSVDACSVAPLRAVTPAVFLAAVGPVTYLFANAEEAAVLGGLDDPDASGRALAAAAGEVVVTRGSRGVGVFAGESRWSEDAGGADVVDTTGAGDAAVGAYLGARLRGLGVEVALANAMAESARAVGRLGAR